MTRLMFAGAGAAQLPGITQTKTYARWKVWKGSVKKTPATQPISRENRRKLYYDARRFEKQTRRRPLPADRWTARNGGVSRSSHGIIGPGALRVLEILLFEFMCCKTGALFPSYIAIAEKSGIPLRSVARYLRQLNTAGILNWVQRCYEDFQEGGGFLLRQESNAYAVLPPSQWKGYHRLPDPPTPDPDAWGRSPWDANGAAYHQPGRDGESLAEVVERATRRRRLAGAEALRPTLFNGSATLA